MRWMCLMRWMFGFDDLDVFNVLYVLDVLDDLDVFDILDVHDVLDLAKVCSEKISLIELHCRNGYTIFYLPYIGAEMLRSYMWMDGWMGLGMGSLCGAIV